MVRLMFAVNPLHTGPFRTFRDRFLASREAVRFEPVLLTPTPEWEDPHHLAQLMTDLGVQLVYTEGYSFMLARAAALAGIPHVFFLGAVIEQGVRDYRPEQRGPVLLALSALARRIICPSDFVAAPLRELGVDNVTVIPNGVDLEWITPRGEPFLGPVPVVGMIAHFMPSKRHLDFIRAARKDARFVIFGEAYPTPLSQDYHREIARAAEERVELRTMGDDIPGALAGIDVMVLPSEQEGASNAILESMAAGRPVIAACSGGNPEQVVHGETGLLFPLGDVEALAASIRSLLDEPERARAMGRAGRQRVERHFSLARAMREYADLYESLAA